jgi:hypothetical protein
MNDCENKGIEWKNLALLPQLLAPRGGKIDRPTTEPGAVIRYDPISGQKPEWRPVPPIPDSLFQLRQNAIEDMEAISSQRSPSGGVDSGKGMATFIESEARRGQLQTGDLAAFHSRLGRHLLLWVQERYTEERLLTIEGRHGVEYIPDFKGAKIREQTAVRVLPGSIEPLTRAAIEQKVMNYAQMGWLSKEQAIAAINNGTAQDLIDTYELNVSKQHREIQTMIAMGNEALPGGDIPIAAPFDEDPIHMEILTRWMLTKEFEEEPPQVQEAANLHYQQHEQQKYTKEMLDSQQQTQQAEQMGMSNAARPQGQAKPLPSLPALNRGQ